jgi:actin-related protein
MMNNVILCGGTTMMPGFPQRIKINLSNSTEYDGINSSNFQVIAEGNRDISTWIGASMVSSMSSFDKIFIRREDFLEGGEDRVFLFSKIF